MAPKRKQAAVAAQKKEKKEEEEHEENSEEEGSPAKDKKQKAAGKGGQGSSKRSKKDEEASASKEEKDSDKVEPVTDAGDVPEGLSRDSRGRLTFKDHPEFKPTLTPKQVIQAGSFGGIYFNPKGGKKGMLFPDGVPISADDFPKDWFEGLRDEQYKGTRYNTDLNKYKVKSGQNQQQWEEQGWIKKDSIDKRGWFEWYCHFTMGRRCDDDKRQISRWTGVAGPKGRWKTRLVNLVKDGSGDVNDASISPVIRQNLLHWAYELTKEDFEAMAAGER